MSKTQFLLIFICSFMFAASIVEANTRYSFENCGNALENSNFKEKVLLDRIRLMESQQDLEKQGYSSKYTAGLDNIKINLQIAHLIHRRFNDPNNPVDDPEKVHIPEFARLIDSHIDFIEQGIRLQDSSDRDTRLLQLAQLKVEAQFVREAKQVIYRWWLNFNARLAILATPQQNRYNDDLFGYYFESKWLKSEKQNTKYNIKSGIMEDGLNSYLELEYNQFPKKIIIPTIQGDFGIISSNRTYGTGVHLIGLINNSIQVHQTFLSPIGFLRHDLSHADGLMDKNPIFTNFFIHKLMNLPKPQRERVELILYELTHEYNHQLSEMIKLEMIEIQRQVHTNFHYNNNYKNKNEFLPFMPPGHHTSDDIDMFLQQAQSDFVKFVIETHAEFNSLENTTSL